jgi:UDP-glucose 4-epimerase
MARILITGGAGYVGSHCAKTLAAVDMRVSFDNLLFGHRELVRWGPLIGAIFGGMLWSARCFFFDLSV